MEHVRRIVTDHDQHGRAVIASDSFVALEKRALEKWFGAEIWRTSRMRVVHRPDGSENPAEDGTARTVLRATTIMPGGVGVMHRTETVDYAILVKGEAQTELDNGKIVQLFAGDIVVQCGTIHAWHNHSNKPCRFIFAQIDAPADNSRWPHAGSFLGLRRPSRLPRACQDNFD